MERFLTRIIVNVFVPADDQVVLKAQEGMITWAKETGIDVLGLGFDYMPSLRNEVKERDMTNG